MKEGAGNLTMTSMGTPSDLEDLRKALAETSVELEETKEATRKRLAL